MKQVSQTSATPSPFNPTANMTTISSSQVPSHLILTSIPAINSNGDIDPLALLLTFFATNTCIYQLFPALSTLDLSSPTIVSGLATRVAEIALSPTTATAACAHLTQDSSGKLQAVVGPFSTTLACIGVDLASTTKKQAKRLLVCLVTAVLGKIAANKPVAFGSISARRFMQHHGGSCAPSSLSAASLPANPSSFYLLDLGNHDTVHNFASTGQQHAHSGPTNNASITTHTPLNIIPKPSSSPIVPVKSNAHIPPATAPSAATPSDASPPVQIQATAASSPLQPPVPHDDANGANDDDEGSPAGTTTFPEPPITNADGTRTFRQPLVPACKWAHALFHPDRHYDRSWSATADDEPITICAYDIQFFVMRVQRCRPVSKKQWAAMTRARKQANDVAGQAIVEELRSQYRKFVTADWLQAVQHVGQWLGVEKPNCVRFAKKVAVQAEIRRNAGYLDGASNEGVKVGMLRRVMADVVLALFWDLPASDPMHSVQESNVEAACGVRWFAGGHVFLEGPEDAQKVWSLADMRVAVQKTLDEIDSGKSRAVGGMSTQ